MHNSPHGRSIWWFKPPFFFFRCVWMKRKNVNTRNRLKNRDEVSGPLCILTDNILKRISTPCNKVRDIYCTTSIVTTRSMLQTTPSPKRLLGQKPPPLHVSMTIVHKREKIPVFPSHLNQQGLLKRCLPPAGERDYGEGGGHGAFSSQGPAKTDQERAKGKMTKEDVEGKDALPPPLKMFCCIFGQQKQISRRIKNQNIRLIKFHSHTRCTKRTILPCWNTKPTHTLIQAARRSVHSVKQRPTRSTQCVCCGAVQEARLFFTTAPRIDYCSRLYFGETKKKKTKNQHTKTNAS